MTTDEIVTKLRGGWYSGELRDQAADRLETLQSLIRLAAPVTTPPTDELAVLRLMVEALHLREANANAEYVNRCHQ